MKLIKESLVQTFSREGDDKISSLGVGTKAKIKEWLDNYGVSDYVILHDNAIDVNDDVRINDKSIKKLPDYIKFNNVFGCFEMDHCGLSSMIGFPNLVENFLSVMDNNLDDSSADFFPKTIGESIYISGNKFSNEFYQFLNNKFPNRSIM